MKKCAAIKITGDFVGYLWYSNSDKPEIINKNVEKYLDFSKVDNPFIIEGQLFDGYKSYSIKCADGEFIVYETEVGEKDDDDVMSYVPNSHFEGVRGLKFVRRWVAENDSLCDSEGGDIGMPVLVPAELVFLGFE